MDSSKSINARNSKFRRELRNRILKHYSLEELRILADDLSLDWDELPGQTKSLKVNELIGYMDRRNTLSELTRYLRQDRPRVDWPGYPQGSTIDMSFEYEASGKTYEGASASNSGKALLTYAIEGEYYDDGLAFAEAVSTTADHIYTFEVEKKGHMGLSELHVSIFNLEYTIDLPSE